MPHLTQKDHFENVLSSQSLGFVLKKLNPTQQQQAKQE